MEEPKEDCVIIDVELNIINLQNYRKSLKIIIYLGVSSASKMSL